MILEWAQEAGIDLETLEAEAAQADREQQRDDAKQHELSISARKYAEMVEGWFGEEFAVEHNVHDDTTGKSKNTEDDIDVSDAIEVVRWYQFFVAAKVFRALMALERPRFDVELPSDEILAGPEPDDDEAFDDEAFLAAVGNDADGSAKIALIAIDRSSSAWRILQSALPEKADSIVPMLLELERLRRATEQTFPEARDFIRPGFDEVISDFLS